MRLGVFINRERYSPQTQRTGEGRSTTRLSSHNANSLGSLARALRPSMRTTESDKLMLPFTKTSYSFCSLSVVLGDRTRDFGHAKQAFYYLAILARCLPFITIGPFQL